MCTSIITDTILEGSALISPAIAHMLAGEPPELSFGMKSLVAQSRAVSYTSRPENVIRPMTRVSLPQSLLATDAPAQHKRGFAEV